MKIKKIENRLAFFILTLALFLLNINYLNISVILIGSILSYLLILLIEHFKVYNFKITKVILTIFSILFLTIYLNKITYFISDNILREYSTISISLTLIITIFILGNKGYHTIIKVILLSLYFILFLFILGFLTNIPYIEASNITSKVLLSNNLFLSSLYYTILIIYPYFLIYPISNTKFKYYDLIFSSSYQIISYLVIISILSTTLFNLYKYPFITIFKMVNLIGFIERIEIIFSLNYLFCFYYLLVLSFYTIKSNLNLVIKKDKNLNITLIFLSLIIFLISIIIQ